ncbi:hypothetical protein EJB05_57519, partial [Eragrostis curvula]
MEEVRCGYDEFIGKEELERRRESLLQGDCLAIRCDVGVMDLQPMFIEPPRQRTGHDDDEDYESGWEDADDTEYVRRCLAAQRNRT